jgi:hypothetical protein
MAYMDEEARRNQAAMQAEQQQAVPEQGGQYMDSESMRNKPKGSGARQATEAEEKQYMMATKQALEYLFSQEVTQILLQTAQQSDPAQAIASIAVQVIEGIASSAKGAGVELSDELLLAVGYQVAINAAGFLASAGVIEQSQESIQMTAENAVSIGRDMVMQARG